MTLVDFESPGNFKLGRVGKINVVLGKNGCGKSHLLKLVEQHLTSQTSVGLARYISPERGGTLTWDPNIENNMGRISRWLADERRKNQSSNFRQQSATLFRRLELLELRDIETQHTQAGYVPRTFDVVVDQLNTLLDRVLIQRDNERAFKILERGTESTVPPDSLSSGEAELVSLGIELLSFSREADKDKDNYLLIDEPDVHLHPDLQYRLSRFMIDAVRDSAVRIILATHSTALLSGLSAEDLARVAFMRRGDKEFKFRAVSDADKSILPIFGAHPLSNVFNEAPILLVEGEDDERIWQQSVRSSGGRIRVFPCVAGSVDNLAEFEREADAIIGAVYDGAVGYSLRDRDGVDGEIDDVGCIIRMRLNCRAAENLMLSDEVLQASGLDWATLQSRIHDWVAANNSHQYHNDVVSFEKSGFDRRSHNIKSIRNVLVGLVSDKPWEVLVGKEIARISAEGGSRASGSMRDFLGEKVCSNLLNL